MSTEPNSSLRRLVIAISIGILTLGVLGVLFFGGNSDDEPNDTLSITSDPNDRTATANATFQGVPSETPPPISMTADGMLTSLPPTSIPTAGPSSDDPTPTTIAYLDDPPNGSGSEEDRGDNFNIVPETVNVEVRNIVGEQIGVGTLYLYHPTELTYGPEQIIIELKLELTDLYVTADETVDREEIGGTTAEPTEVPQYNESGIEMYELMGASLLCSQELFSGCDGPSESEIDVSRARPVSNQGITWFWFVNALQNRDYSQGLRLEVWAVNQRDGNLEPLQLWSGGIFLTVAANPDLPPTDGTSAGTGDTSTEPDDDDNSSIYLLSIGLLALAVAIIGGSQWYAAKKRVKKGNEKYFISYRRQDSAGTTGRIYDRMVARLGENAIFRDVDTIEAGENFVEAIENAVNKCDIFIAIIGHEWITITDQEGRRRLDNPQDYVRIELSTALKSNLRVIPVLVDGATMPTSDQLPDNLKAITYRNAIEIRNERFDDDVLHFLSAIE